MLARRQEKNFKLETFLKVQLKIIIIIIIRNIVWLWLLSLLIIIVVIINRIWFVMSSLINYCDHLYVCTYSNIWYQRIYS